MAWLGLILGLIALAVAISTRTEQMRQRLEIQRLRSMLTNTPVASPAQRQQASVPSRAEAIDTPTEVKDAPRRDERAAQGIPPAPPPAAAKPVPDKKEALHRLAQPTPDKDTDARAEKTPQTGPVPRPVGTPRVSVPAKNVPLGKGSTKPKRSTSLEEVIGAKLYIWAAGICLMLAGAFLVKFSFDKNLLTVGTRLCIAAGFGLTLVLTSQWAKGKSERIGAALCGAGVADLFATVLAATAYYQLVDPWLGFAAMVGVTALAVVFSLIHGPYVALLGLIGGFVTPALIGGEESAWGPTFTYLLLLEIGLTAVTRRRGWFGLSAATLFASLTWALVYTLFAWDPNSRLYMIGFVLGTSVLFVLSAARSLTGEQASRSPLARLWLAVGAVGSCAMLLSLLVAYSRFSLIEMSALGILGAGGLLLARLDYRYLAVTFLSAGLCAMTALAWPIAHALLDTPFHPHAFYTVIIGYGGVFAAGGLLCLWRHTRPLCFVWLSASASMVFTVIAHAGAPGDLPGALRWWMVYAGVGVLLAGAATVVWRGRSRHGTKLIDAYALTAIAMATVAIGLGVKLPWTAPSWAGLALLVTITGTRLRLPQLRIATGWLTALTLLLLLVPGPAGYEPGGWSFLNRMLAHYSLPTVCFGLIAWLYRRGVPTFQRDAYQVIALLVGVAALTLQVRYGFQPEAFHSAPPGLYEWATYAVLLMLVAVPILWRLRSLAFNGLRTAALLLGPSGLAMCVIGLLVSACPLFVRAPLGDWPVLNGLLFAYGVPCASALALGWVARDRYRPVTQAASAISFALLFALLTLLVRHGFVGQDMRLLENPEVALTEWPTYALVWMAVAWGMLWWDRRRHSNIMTVPATILTLAGMVVMALGPILLDNPLMHTADVGAWPIVNRLLYVYGLPCAAVALMARWLPDRARQVRPIASVLAILLLFALVTLEVRQLFVGPDLTLAANHVTSAENYAYSLAWVVLGIALLTGGIIRDSKTLRYASLAVMLIAVGKVFIFDTKHLRDLWRVLSFLGLGVSLMALGYVYQRFVFNNKKNAPTEHTDAVGEE